MAEEANLRATYGSEDHQRFERDPNSRDLCATRLAAPAEYYELGHACLITVSLCEVWIMLLEREMKQRSS
jgi:hypothetical protein